MTDYIDKYSNGSTTYDLHDSGARESIADLDENKANVDGYYEQMTVGNAEQLVATVGVEDNAPYNFRTAGGSADIGDRLVEKVVGGTICWNQIQENKTSKVSAGVTFTYNEANGKLTVNGTAESNTWWLTSNDKTWDFYKDHVYLLDVGNKDYGNAGSRGLNPYWYVPSGFSSNSLLSSAVIRKCTTSVKTYLQFMIYTGNEVDATYIPQVFDLTQMFGSTIADYILSLETATAGAGVAWFRHLFPKPYYAYNAGELMSVQAVSHITRGFNAWDEEWDEGAINVDTGENYNQTGRVRVKNYIPILPNTTYYKKSPDPGMYWHIYYDADKNWVGKAGVAYNSTFTTPSNAYYMRSYTENGYGSTYKNDICINLSWDGERDGEYEPYTLHEYPLDSSLTLRGIPKLDANNELYYDGDEYESDGTVTRKCGTITFDGSNDESWALYAPDNYDSLCFYIAVSGKAIGSMLSISNSFTNVNVAWGADGNGKYKVFSDHGSNRSLYFRQPNADVSTITEWRAWLALNPVTVVYPLESATTETADPFQNPQIVDDFGTEEYVDAAVTADPPTRDVAIPVGHVSQYQANLRAKLEMAPNSPDGDGDYIVRQTNGQNEYVALTFPADELPAAPTDNGTYTLKCTVSGSGTTYAWVADT